MKLCYNNLELVKERVMTMTERQIINLIEITLNEKMEQNENFIRYSFYEVNIKYCLKGNEIEQFVNLLKTKLVNNKYKVYLEGQKFEYNNANMTVQDNEILIAIKEEKEVLKDGRKVQKTINR